MVSSVIPGLVVLGSIRKQAEQVMGSKPVSNPTTTSWLLYQVLPQDPVLFEFLS